MKPIPQTTAPSSAASPEVTRAPRRLRRVLVVFLLGVLGLIFLFLAVVKWRYGGGAAYPDLSTPPLVPAAQVRAIAALDFPPACVAVSVDGRIFFDYHAFAQPKRFGENVLFELVDGQPRPFPDTEAQKNLRAPFGLTVDGQGRLWTVESGGLEGFPTRVLAFDIHSGDLVVEHELPQGVGTFAQDLRVTPDGNTVILADTGLFRFTAPALLALDVKSGAIKAQLRDHPSLAAMDYRIRRFDGKPHRLAMGLISFQVGVDGLAISPDGVWLVYAAMNHDGLYRLPLSDWLQGAPDIFQRIERIGTKPLSDGIEVDASGRTYVTDIEHGGIMAIQAEGPAITLVSLPQVIWADSVALAPDRSIIFTDSAIPAYIQQWAQPPGEDLLRSLRPFHIYRAPNPFP